MVAKAMNSSDRPGRGGCSAAGAGGGVSADGGGSLDPGIGGAFMKFV
jgi:hypothetical protein